MLNTAIIAFGKVLSSLLQLMGHHGAALPGLIIERLYPNFLPTMLGKLPDGVVVVSGTNGKTTTTKMITELLAAEGKRVLTNKTGGNFVRGVISTIAQAADGRANLAYDIAVFEQDEAYAVKFVKLFQPRVTVLLNVTRDQLDRFGEIDTTASLLQLVANQTTQVVILNDDDPRLNKVMVHGETKAEYFGISPSLAKQFPSDDELYGKAHTKPTSHPRVVELEAVNGNNASYKFSSGVRQIALQIDGQHNALNAAAAMTATKSLLPKVSDDKLLKTLSGIKAAFGRGEVIDYQGKRLILQLVKNPSSFRQALHVLDIHKPESIGIIINDDYADGRDVSWLWDVQFKPLATLPVTTAGTRGYDMANRLRYDEIKVQSVQEQLEGLVSEVTRQTNDGQSAIIFATYTAMLAARKVISRQTEVAKI